MPKIINDEFSRKRISRQAKYQLRMRKAGRCTICGERAEKDRARCAKHLSEQRKRYAKC